MKKKITMCAMIALLSAINIEGKAQGASRMSIFKEKGKKVFQPLSRVKRSYAQRKAEKEMVKEAEKGMRKTPIRGPRWGIFRSKVSLPESGIQKEKGETGPKRSVQFTLPEESVKVPSEESQQYQRAKTKGSGRLTPREIKVINKIREQRGVERRKKEQLWEELEVKLEGP